jgi:hypothetical protein
MGTPSPLWATDPHARTIASAPLGGLTSNTFRGNVKTFSRDASNDQGNDEESDMMRDYLHRAARVVAPVCFVLAASSLALGERSVSSPRAFPDGLFVSETSVLRFTAEVAPDPALKVKKVKLFTADEQGHPINQIGRLYDDGSHGDLVVGDGVFTAEYSFRPSVAQVLTFIVRSQYRSAPKKLFSPILRISVFERRTDDEIRLQMETQDKAREVFLNTLGAGDAAARGETVSFLHQQSAVKDAGISSDGRSIWVTYNNGHEGVIFTNPGGTRGGAVRPHRESVSHNTYDWSAPPSKGKGTNQPIALPEGENAIVLAPFFDSFSPFDSSDLVAASLGRTCGSNVRVLKNQEVSAGELTTLFAQYTVIYIATHGGVSGDQVVFATGELDTYTTERTYELDLVMHRLTTATTLDLGTYLAVTPAFVNYYSSLNKFPNSLVYLDACDSLGENGHLNPTLRDAFLQNGAAAYFGWLNTVNSAAAKFFSRSILDFMSDSFLSPSQRTAKAAFDEFAPEIDPQPVDGVQAVLLLQGKSDRFLCVQGVVPDFLVSAAPTGQGVLRGSNAVFSINVQSINGFTGSVNLFALNLPGNLVPAGTGFNPPVVTPAAGGIAASSFTLVTNAATPTGTFTITFRGVSGSLVRETTASLNVTVPAPDFLVSAAPSSQGVLRGSNAVFSINVQSINGFTGSVNLFALNLPGNLVPAGTGFNPPVVTPAAGGIAASSFTLVTNAATPTGTFTITFRGVSGSLVRETTASVSVSATGTPPVWLTFIEGNPGIPGDGVFVSASIGVNTFRLSTPIPLSSFTDGFTLTVFLPPNISNFGSASFIVTAPNRSGSCQARFGAFGRFPAGRVSFNGVVGLFENTLQADIEDAVRFANQVNPGCGLTVSDLYLSEISLNSTALTQITTLDAAALGLGQNNFPGIRLP